eukprot:3106006-Amphidinium_carterae.1
MAFPNANEVEQRGRKHAKGRPRGAYRERDVVPFPWSVRVPPARATGPQRAGERLQPNPQGQAVGLTTYLSKAPWGMTEGLVGRPLLLAADSQSAPESTWARTSSMSASGQLQEGKHRWLRQQIRLLDEADLEGRIPVRESRLESPVLRACPSPSHETSLAKAPGLRPYPRPRPPSSLRRQGGEVREEGWPRLSRPPNSLHTPPGAWTQ